MALGRQGATAAIGSETIHQSMAFFEHANDCPKRYQWCGSCKAKTATCTALGQDESCARQLADDFGQVIAGHVQFRGEFICGEQAIRLASKAHEGT